MRWLLLISMVLAAAGCGESLPATIPELSQVTVEARDQAEAAREAQKPDEAAAAADRAAAAVVALDEIVDAAETINDKDKALREQAVSAAHKAKYFAELADEEMQRADKLDSWKASGYSATRKVCLKATFAGLSLAAQQAGQQDFESLPEVVQASADFAADLAKLLSDRERLPNGQPDWEGIAADMDAIAESPTPKQIVYLSLAFLMIGQEDFALFEAESVPVDQLDEEQRRDYRYLRAFIYSFQDWRHLAVMEIDQVEEGDSEQSAQILAGFHLLLAYTYIKEEQEYLLGEQELIRAARLWSNNPVLVFLTGEQLAATGEYEKAAESLESLAGDSEHPMAIHVAARIADRARELRDGEPGQSLLMDKSFMLEMAFYYLVIAAEKSEMAAEVKQHVASARAFGERMMAHMPGVAGEEEHGGDVESGQ